MRHRWPYLPINSIRYHHTLQEVIAAYEGRWWDGRDGGRQVRRSRLPLVAIKDDREPLPCAWGVDAVGDCYTDYRMNDEGEWIRRE